jgi:hypothetical protein
MENAMHMIAALVALLAIVATMQSPLMARDYTRPATAEQGYMVAQAQADQINYRVLRFGMMEPEVVAALSTIGFSGASEVMPGGEQAIVIRKDGESYGRLYFDANKKLNKMSLDASYFGISGKISLKDFVKQLSDAYHASDFQSEIRSTMIGDMWVYRGHARNGDVLTVADPTGMGAPAVRIDPAQRGMF